MLTVDFINVGYGDAILIREQKSGYSMLVDCGDVTTGTTESTSGRIAAADFLLQEQIKKLDLLVVTHLHRDHTGGLLDVLQNVQVAECWTNFLPCAERWDARPVIEKDYSPGAICLVESLEIYLKALKIMLEHQHTLVRKIDAAQENVMLAPGLKADVYVEGKQLFDQQDEICERILSGAADGKALDALDAFVNNASIRIRLEYSGASVELPGDTCAYCWKKHRLKKCSIVKLPHHGHPDSMDEGLLSVLAPDYVVVSTSDSRTDDCPSLKVIETIRRYGLEPMFTDAVSWHGVAADRHQAVRMEIMEDGHVRAAYHSVQKIK